MGKLKFANRSEIYYKKSLELLEDIKSNEEIRKIITQQFIPVDIKFEYDGNETGVFNIEESKFKEKDRDNEENNKLKQKNIQSNRVMTNNNISNSSSNNNKDNFTSAIRKLISRMVALTRQEMGIQNSVKLKHCIINEDLWNRSIVEKDGFENEIDDIFKFDVTVGQSYKLFIALNGENILNNKLFKKKAKEVDLHMRKVSSGSENMINTDSDMKRENNENEAERRNSTEEKSDNEHSESGSDDSDEEMRDDEI